MALWALSGTRKWDFLACWRASREQWENLRQTSAWAGWNKAHIGTNVGQSGSVEVARLDRGNQSCKHGCIPLWKV
jgi:hypothetical protein